MYGARFSENAGQSLLSFLQEDNSNIVQLIKLVTNTVIEYFELIVANVMHGN